MEIVLGGDGGDTVEGGMAYAKSGDEVMVEWDKALGRCGR